MMVMTKLGNYLFIPADTFYTTGPARVFNRYRHSNTGLPHPTVPYSRKHNKLLQNKKNAKIIYIIKFLKNYINTKMDLALIKELESL